jgi:hypothetical protein
MLPGSAWRRTQLWRNSRAFIARFWVAAATFPCTARSVKEGFNRGFGGEKVVTTRSYAMETDEPYDQIRIQELGVHGSNRTPRAPGPSARGRDSGESSGWFILIFHNLSRNIAISGNQQGRTQYMDSKQPTFPYPTCISIIRGKSVHL